MAPRIPRGFGAAKKDEKAGPSDDKARPAHKKDNTKETPQPPTETLKRNVEVPKEPIMDKNKKQKTQGAPSYAETLIGSAAASLIGDKELNSWQNMNAHDEANSMIKASAQLLVHSLGRAQRVHKERLQLNKLEADNRRLAKLLVESDNKWKKDLDARDVEITSLKLDLQKSVDHGHFLIERIDKLEKEKEDLQVKVDSLEIEKSDCWGDEKQAMEDRNFQAGFDFYMLGFIANDPDYDWEGKFGAGSAEDVAEFKVRHADAIKAKRIELGLEKALEGAPPTEDIPQTHSRDAETSPPAIAPEQSTIPETTQPLQTQDASPSKDAP